MCCAASGKPLDAIVRGVESGNFDLGSSPDPHKENRNDRWRSGLQRSPKESRTHLSLRGNLHQAKLRPRIRSPRTRK